MSFGEDEEILQDFLVEAGEILDQLSSQLVEMEQRPDDKDLLNAIFRGFHTVKGGAGFLQLEAMVSCCHLTENLFDILRNGERSVTPELMDVVLQALDTVNAQFEKITNREQPDPPSPELIAKLERLVSCEDIAEGGGASTPAETKASHTENTAGDNVADTAQDESGFDISDAEFEGYLDAIDTGAANAAQSENTAQPESTAGNPQNSASGGDELFGDDSAVSNDGDDISEDEFEALLDKLHGPGSGPTSAPKSPQGSNESSPAVSSAVTNGMVGSDAPGDSSSDEISESEFEALLDQLHGSGAGPSSSKPTQSAPEKNAAPPAAEKPAKVTTGGAADSSSNSNLITDDEFENLLDQLHGQGKGPQTNASSASKPKEPASKPSPVSKPESKPEPEKPAANKVAASAPIDKPTTPAAPPARSGGGNVTPMPSKAPAVPASGGGGGSPAPRENVAANRGAVTAPAAEATVRVDTQRLDDIMNMVGELVLVRNRLVRLGLDSGDESLSKAVGNLDVVTADLQTAVMKTRMQPIKKVFGRFPRVVRDLARNLKKEISLELVGEDTDLDKNLVEALADPLVHLVRNSVDHGIELPADREANSKPRTGKVILAAQQEGDHILLSITDDGGGMDPDKLRQKAVEKGILDHDSAGRLSDLEAFNLIFAPGFSTKSEISDVSGRGVGMDVVKTKISQLNGSIDIQSKLGEGTRIAIKVPLTLAIMPTLMIMLGKQTFALPLASVNEIFHMDLTRANIVDSQECITIRDKSIPIFHLKRWLVRGPQSMDKVKEGHVVIVTVGTRRVGFVVDQLIGQEEVVIKPLGKMLQGTPGMAGATITGDGTIALILDVPSLLREYAGGM